MTTLTDHLAEIQARCNRATEGPWTAEYSGEQGNCVLPPGYQSTREAVAVTRLLSAQADAEFIAHSRTDLPALLAAVEAVMGLHRPDTVLAVTGDCALEDCDHEDLKDCETVEVRFCAACDELAEQVDPHYMEGSVALVHYPCSTVRAITAALEVQG